MKKELQTAFHTRQYMLSKDFEIYYYHDVSFSGVKSHTHDYYEFYFFIEGSITMWINEVPHVLKPGDVLLIPPNVPHYATCTDAEIPYRRFVFWLSEDYCSELANVSECYVYLMKQASLHRRHHYHYDVIGFHALQAKIFRIIEELHSDRFGREVRIPLCVNELLLHMNRTVFEADHPKTSKSGQSLYENLMQYIETHLDEDLTLDSLAKELYVSKYHIAHVFKKNLGLSIHQFITKKRLEICKNAILSGTNISEAYLAYGFKDYSSFFRAFKKEYGISPKEYKEQHILPEMNESEEV